jgi:hypothetical protein
MAGASWNWRSQEAKRSEANRSCGIFVFPNLVPIWRNTHDTFTSYCVWFTKNFEVLNPTFISMSGGFASPLDDHHTHDMTAQLPQLGQSQSFRQTQIILSIFAGLGCTSHLSYPHQISSNKGWFYTLITLLVTSSVAEVNPVKYPRV